MSRKFSRRQFGKLGGLSALGVAANSTQRWTSAADSHIAIAAGRRWSYRVRKASLARA